MTATPTPPAQTTAGAPDPQPRPRRRRWVRIVRVVAIVGVALLVLLHLAGGWYFSGQISADALRVDPATVDRDVRVAAVGPGSITLRTGDDALRSNLVYGLDWAGGYGQVSGPPQQSGGAVVRDFRVLTGTTPRPGERVGPARDAFPDDPAVALGRPVGQVTVATPLGPAPAWFVPGRSATWAVLVHGWTASRTEMLRLMRSTVAAGMPSLDITYRNDVGAPADPSGRYGFGRSEWPDLQAAVTYARAPGASSVVLVGASMGAAVIAAFLEHSPQRAAVSALVLDSPMLSFGRVVELGASRRSLPLVGLPVPPTLTWTAERFATVRYGVDWPAVDYLDDTAWDGVPTLVIHGDDDTRVPISGSRDLARARPANVTLVVVHGAGHVESWNAGPHAYDTAVQQFLAGPGTAGR